MIPRMPILPDQVGGCPFLTSDLGRICGVSAKSWCRDGCSVACAQLMIHEARMKGRW